MLIGIKDKEYFMHRSLQDNKNDSAIIMRVFSATHAQNKSYVIVNCFHDDPLTVGVHVPGEGELTNGEG